MLRYAVMAMLRHQSDHGYRLFRRFETASGGAWRLNRGSIYHTIKQLIERGEISADRTEGEIREPDHADESVLTYHLTQAGQTNLDSWLRQPLRRPEAFRSEIVMRLLVALNLDPDSALEQVDTATARYAEHLDTLEVDRQRTPAHERDHLCHDLLLDGAIRETQSRLSWLSYCRSRLTSAAQADKTPSKEQSNAA